MLFGALNFVIYRYLKWKRRIEGSNMAYSWLLLMTFLILPSISTKIFTTFACVTFDGEYGRYLKADLSINCDSEEHQFYQYVASMGIVIYPIGVPLMYALNLWSDRALLDPGQERLASRYGEIRGLEMALEERKRIEDDEEHKHIKSLTFLYDSYEPKYYYFEVVDTIRKVRRRVYNTSTSTADTSVRNRAAAYFTTISKPINNTSFAASLAAAYAHRRTCRAWPRNPLADQHESSNLPRGHESLRWCPPLHF